MEARGRRAPRAITASTFGEFVPKVISILPNLFLTHVLQQPQIVLARLVHHAANEVHEAGVILLPRIALTYKSNVITPEHWRDYRNAQAILDKSQVHE